MRKEWERDLGSYLVSGYTLDTNALIDDVKDDPRAVPILHDILKSDTIALSVPPIPEAERFGFPSLTETEATMMNNLLRGVSLIPVDSHSAPSAGRIRTTERLKLADSIIMATSLFTGSPLLRNARDFKKVPTLSVQAL